MTEEENTEGIDYQAVVAQLQEENEKLRERIASGMLSNPIGDAIDGVIVVVKHTDPMKLYLWACIICICITAVVQVIEVLFK